MNKETLMKHVVRILILAGLAWLQVREHRMPTDAASAAGARAAGTWAAVSGCR